MKDNQVITGTLHDWETASPVGSEEYVIWGYVKGDTRGRFRDGLRIHTSGISPEVFPIDGLKEGSVVKTRNSVYLLGAAY